MTCTHHWTTTSECPKCLRMQLDRAIDAIARYINAQGPHMSPSWKKLLVEECDMEIDEGNPYEPVIQKGRT